MIYLIDANNLAGKLGILKNENFDKLLIKIIRHWPASRKNKIFLVFDSADPMGDKYSENLITIIYTPRDNYYHSADDKIIELANDYLNSNNKFKPEDGELCVVTDDNEIKNKIKFLNRKYNRELILMPAFNLADKLNRLSAVDYKNDNYKESGRRGLKESEIDKINKDLLKIWQ